MIEFSADFLLIYNRQLQLAVVIKELRYSILLLVTSPVTLLWTRTVIKVIYIAMATRHSPRSGEGFDKFRRQCVGELDWSRVATPLGISSS